MQTVAICTKILVLDEENLNGVSVYVDSYGRYKPISDEGCGAPGAREGRSCDQGGGGPF